MINNEQEYRITKTELAKFTKAIDSFDMEFNVRPIGGISQELRQTELNALRSEKEVLERQMKEYEDKNVPV